MTDLRPCSRHGAPIALWKCLAVLGESAAINEADLSVVRDFAGAGVPVFLAAPDGSVVASITS